MKSTDKKGPQFWFWSTGFPVPVNGSNWYSYSRMSCYRSLFCLCVSMNSESQPSQIRTSNKRNLETSMIFVACSIVMNKTYSIVCAPRWLSFDQIGLLCSQSSIRFVFYLYSKDKDKKGHMKLLSQRSACPLSSPLNFMVSMTIICRLQNAASKSFSANIREN